MTSTTLQEIRLGHSPDPDDAFMWYPLADFPDGSGPGGRTYTPQIPTAGYRFRHILEDIESLNQRCERSELEITALSIHQYAHVADRYRLTSCGASMGDGYGPMVVAPKAMQPESLGGKTLAIPGLRTSAWLALQLWMKDLGLKQAPKIKVVPFDQIIAATADGRCDAGLIIHEGQLTYANQGLERVVDLGEWWKNRTGLPLPLGGNAIRRDLDAAAPVICRVLDDCIRYALDHRQEALDYALQYARDMGRDLADRFVGMYVNDYTLHYGEKGQAGVERFLREATEAGLIPPVKHVDWVEPA